MWKHSNPNDDVLSPKIAGNTLADNSGTKRSSSSANKTFVAPPLSYHGRHIQELLLKVKLIEDECLGHNEEKKEKLDEFVALKKEIYVNIFSTKKLIRERCEIQSAKGNTVEAIEKGTVIKTNVDLMAQQFIRLKDSFKKQSKQTKSNNLTASELDTRFQELQVIKQQVEECRELMKRGTEYSDSQMRTLTDFVKQMEQAGVAPPAQFDSNNGAGGWREPTAEEQATISRWAERDKDFDRQIWQVGAGVDRLKDIAITIGEKAREQEEATVRLSRQADEANEQVIEVNAKLKSLMLQRGGFNFCCKLILTVVLIILLGFIVKNVSNRITMPRRGGRRMKAISHSDDQTYDGDSQNTSINRKSIVSTFGRNPTWASNPALAARQRVFINGTLRPLDENVLQLMLNESNPAESAANRTAVDQATSADYSSDSDRISPHNRSSVNPLLVNPSAILWDVIESTSRNSWSSRFQKPASRRPSQPSGNADQITGGVVNQTTGISVLEDPERK